MKHQGPIAGIAVDGKYIATAGYDNQVILWDIDQHQAIARGMHDHLVNNCAFSNNGKFLITASSDYTARIWELPSMRLRHVLADHEDDVDMAVFSPDDAYIATCALDRNVRIFDIHGTCMRVCSGHTGNVKSLVWSRDGKTVTSSSVDGTVRQWDVFGDKPARINELGMRTDKLAMDLEGCVYAGDDLGRIARICDGAISYTPAHEAGIKELVLDETLHRLITLSYDRTLAVWQIGSDGHPQEIHRTILPAAIWARSAALMSNGHVAVGTFGGRYAIYDLDTNCWNLDHVEAGPAINGLLVHDAEHYTVGDAGTVLQNGKPIGEMGSLCNFLVMVDEQLFTGGQLGQLYDARTSEVLHTHHSPLNCAVAFHRGDSEEFIVGTYTGELLHFALDAQRKPFLLDTIHAFSNAIKDIAVEDGILFVVCANTAFARYELEHMTQLEYRAKAHERIANACSALGEHEFASIGRDRVLRLWTTQGEEIYPSPHRNSVKCMAISSDRRFLMTGSYGGTLAAFDLAARSWLPTERPTAAGISALAWDATRNCFIAASYDGHLYPATVPFNDNAQGAALLSDFANSTLAAETELLGTLHYEKSSR